MLFFGLLHTEILKNMDQHLFISCMFFLDAAKMWCYCRMVYMPMSYLYGKKFVGPITPLILQLREELYSEPYDKINWPKYRHVCAEVVYPLLFPL